MFATGTTQEETIAKYRAKLAENQLISGADTQQETEGELLEQTIQVDRIEYLVQDGNSYAYLVSDSAI